MTGASSPHIQCEEANDSTGHIETSTQPSTFAGVEPAPSPSPSQSRAMTRMANDDQFEIDDCYKGLGTLPEVDHYKYSADVETSFFDNEDPEFDGVFEPPEVPEGFVPPPSFDDESSETEDEIAAAYEELYGPAYSGVSVLGNDIYVMDSNVKKTGAFGKLKKEKIRDGFEERVVQGQVGVGVGKAKEVIGAVQKSAVNARRNIISVPMTKYLTFPHRSEGDYGAAKVMLRPASPGTGVIAGGSVRIVLEMAGVENALGKQLGSKNALNNARATVVGIQKMRQFSDVARERGIPWKSYGSESSDRIELAKAVLHCRLI
ncbi:30S ribosomal protein S5 chloroplastic [Prunus yedoensis var. nudiflora]|uniref:30S ribosomal protein S5 chloroplastic n=1 Tax=Prunus yedoensis var. nudiflora TaxID=2094558 RepID=A0A314UPF2_PRUYE|nr:30S ribosomal protein S5 chloroplastic [Prunus yedoensis var. nudiflora]